jgi:hypothetical protein
MQEESKWVLAREGSTAHERGQATCSRAREALRKGVKGKKARGAGAGASFIGVESGGWPVHAPSLIQRVAKPEGEGRSTWILFYYFII